MPKKHSRSPDSASHACPRCNYDQSGLIATWADTCPLEGVCSECGYAFAWSDVLNPRRRILRGFFEHASGMWGSWVAALRTLLWTIWPGGFWSKVKMHHEPRLKMLWWIPVWFITLWALVCAVRLATALIWASQGMLSGTALKAEIVNAFIQPVADCYWWRLAGQSRLSLEFWIADWSPGILGLMSQSLLFPVLLLVLPETRRRAKVRPMHIIRATVYGHAWIVCIPITYLAMATEYFVGAVSNTWPHMINDFVMDYYPFIILLVAVWIGVWWWMVLKRCFDVAQPVFHWFVLMVPAVLLVAVFMLFDSTFVMRYFR